MINVSGNKWIPDEGYVYISNGEIWTDSIFIGKDDDISNWHDTNEDPPMHEEDIPDDEALLILLGGEKQ